MSEFRLYLDLGVFHILDFAGYDHMLFVMAIAAIYLLNDWRKVLVLVTAFTIGHSITLALATLELIKYDLELIEFLIPLTIFITALANLFTRDRRRFEATQRKGYINYFFAGFFGTIHGLGFSSYLKVLLGAEQNIIKPLFAFNIGLEEYLSSGHLCLVEWPQINFDYIEEPFHIVDIEILDGNRRKFLLS